MAFWQRQLKTLSTYGGLNIRNGGRHYLNPGPFVFILSGGHKNDRSGVFKMHEWQNLVFHNHKTLSPYTAWQKKNIKAFHVGRIGHFNFIKEGFVFFHLWFNTHWQFCIHKKTISINSTHWLVCLKINCVWVVYLHSHYNTVSYTTSNINTFAFKLLFTTL